MLYITTNKQKIEVYKIAAEMSKYLDLDFIVAAVELACHYEGAYDLMEIWHNSDNKERELVVLDLISLINEENKYKRISKTLDDDLK